MHKENAYEYFDAELIIVSDSINDEDNSKIIEAIRRVDSNMNSISHTVGTNVIVVSGKWSESELAERLEKISKLPRANVYVGKKQRVVVRGPPVEHVSISESVGWSKTKDIIANIIRDIETGEYFKAISASCSYLQVLGKQLLRKSVKEFMEFPQIINSLHSKNIIDDKIRKKLHTIRDYRNSIEHEGTGFQFNSEQAREAEAVAAEALDICKLLEGKKRELIDTIYLKP